jgi:hypothetical protein
LTVDVMRAWFAFEVNVQSVRQNDLRKRLKAARRVHALTVRKIASTKVQAGNP